MAAQCPLAIVEDDAEVRSSLSFWLSTEGHPVLSFGTVAEMIQADLPDGCVFVIDEMLPDGSGVALLRALRRSGRGAPAVIITTNPGPALRRECQEIGAVIVEKPLISDELLGAIQQLLSQGV